MYSTCDSFNIEHELNAYHLIVFSLTSLSTIVQLYHGDSWVSYQFYCSSYPDNSKSVVMLTRKPGQPLLPFKSLWCKPDRRWNPWPLAPLHRRGGASCLKPLAWYEIVCTYVDLYYVHALYALWNVTNNSYTDRQNTAHNCIQIFI